MGIFSPKTAQNSPPPQPDRESHTSTKPYGWLLLSVLVTVLFTGYTVVAAAAILAFEKRRVRTRWFALWAMVTFLLGRLVAGSMSNWYGWLLAQAAVFRLIPDSAASSGALAVAASFRSEPFAAVAATTIAAAPLALLTAAIFGRIRSFSRATRGQIEGESHSNQRPVGILDRQRIQRNRRRVAAAHYTPELQITPPTLADLHAQLAELDPEHVPPDPTEIDELDDVDAADSDTTAATRTPSALHALRQQTQPHVQAISRALRLAGPSPKGGDTPASAPADIPTVVASDVSRPNPFARNTSTTTTAAPAPQPDTAAPAAASPPTPADHVDDIADGSAAPAPATSRVPEPTQDTSRDGNAYTDSVVAAEDSPSATTLHLPAAADELVSAPEHHEPDEEAPIAISLGRRRARTAAHPLPPTRSRIAITAEESPQP